MAIDFRLPLGNRLATATMADVLGAEQLTRSELQKKGVVLRKIPAALSAQMGGTGYALGLGPVPPADTRAQRQLAVETVQAVRALMQTRGKPQVGALVALRRGETPGTWRTSIEWFRPVDGGSIRNAVFGIRRQLQSRDAYAAMLSQGVDPSSVVLIGVAGRFVTLK